MLWALFHTPYHRLATLPPCHRNPHAPRPYMSCCTLMPLALMPLALFWLQYSARKSQGSLMNSQIQSIISQKMSQASIGSPIAKLIPLKTVATDLLPSVSDSAKVADTEASKLGGGKPVAEGTEGADGAPKRKKKGVQFIAGDDGETQDSPTRGVRFGSGGGADPGMEVEPSAISARSQFSEAATSSVGTSRRASEASSLDLPNVSYTTKTAPPGPGEAVGPSPLSTTRQLMRSASGGMTAPAPSNVVSPHGSIIVGPVAPQLAVGGAAVMVMSVHVSRRPASRIRTWALPMWPPHLFHLLNPVQSCMCRCVHTIFASLFFTCPIVLVWFAELPSAAWLDLACSPI